MNGSGWAYWASVCSLREGGQVIVIEAPKDRVEEIRAVVLEAMTSERLQENVLGRFPSKQI